MQRRHSGHDLAGRIDAGRLTSWLWRVWVAVVRGPPDSGRSIATLIALSPGEKALLRRFRDENTRTIHVPSPTCAFGLELAEIVSIRREPERLATGEAFGLDLSTWAGELLSRHPEILRTALPSSPRASLSRER